LLNFPLYFLRHGETFFNAEGRIQGQLDTPLSPRGRTQAVAAGLSLDETMRAAGLAPSAAAYFASPLSRATDTMILARGAMGLDATGFSRDARLMELSFGLWQNLTWPEIRAKYPAAANARSQNGWDFTPPEGESYAALTERVRPWLASLSGPTIAVAHGGVARALMVLAGGLEPSQAYALPIHQGSVLAFRDGRGAWI
jgi:broad specificity phosphatase PhoE